MAYEHKPNSGSLFKNDKREKETHAHARGSALIDGVEYWVSAWTNSANDGSKYQSLKFSRKDENRAPNPANNPPPDDEFQDDIPFAFVLPTLLGLALAGSQIAPVIGGA